MSLSKNYHRYHLRPKRAVIIWRGKELVNIDRIKTIFSDYYVTFDGLCFDFYGRPKSLRTPKSYNSELCIDFNKQFIEKIFKSSIKKID